MVKLSGKILLLGTTMLIAIVGTASAQENTIQRDLLLEKDYNPSVGDAGKIYQMPTTEPLVFNRAEISFLTESSPIASEKSRDQYGVAQPEYYHSAQDQTGYFRIGGGNHFHFVGDGQINLLQDSEKHYLDLNLSHRSEDKPGDALLWDSDNKLGLHYLWQMDKFRFDAALSESFHNWHYYGGELPTLVPSVEIPAQWSSHTAAHVGLQSKPWEKPYQLGASIDGHYFLLHHNPFISENSNSSAESEIDAKAFFSHPINKRLSVRVDGQIRSFFQQFPDDSQSSFWFEITPKAVFFWNAWRFTGGFHLSDLSWKDSPLRISPSFSANRLLRSDLDLTVDIDGGENAFAYREGFEQNLYINPAYKSLRPQYSPFSFQVSANYHPWEYFSIRPLIGYRAIKDFGMFYNERLNVLPDGNYFAAIPYFSVEYANIRHFFLGFNCHAQWKEMIMFTSQFQYNAYSNQTPLFNDKRVWNLPKFEWDARIDSRPLDKLHAAVLFHWAGTRYAFTSGNPFSRMKDICDLGAEVSYQILPKYGVFIQGNNLLDRHYEIWNDYSVNGITVVAGARISF